MATTNLGRVRFNMRGDYNPAADPLYSLLDLVSDGGGSFVYINDTPSNEPTSSASHWQQIASVGGQDLVDAAVAAKNTAVSAKDTAVAAAAQLQAGIGSPAGAYDDLAALNTDNPAHDRTYLTKNDWKLAYYDAIAGAFVAGGVYQAVDVPDQSISPRKTSFFDYSVNLFDPETITDGEFVGGDGAIVSNAGYFTSDYIPITPGKEYVIRNKTFTFQFDSSKNHIWGTYTGAIVYNYVFTAAPGAAYIRVGASYPHITPSSQVFAEGSQIKDNLIKSDFLPQLDSVVYCLFDPDTITDGVYANYDGTYVSNAAFFTSDFIPVRPSSSYYFKHKSFTAEYDGDNNFIASAFTSGSLADFILTTSPVTRYIRFSDVKTALPSISDFIVTNYSSKIANMIEYAFSTTGNEIIVKASGTPGSDCDYAKLTDAMEYAYAHPSGNLTIRVLAGTYDIVTELSSMAGAGPLIGNGMHLIFSPQAYVVCNYTGGNATIEQSFAPINAGAGDFIIEGMNISCANTRYCVHDEMADAPAFTRHEYRNCTMYLDNSASSGGEWACIGGGLGENAQIIIDGGHYESATHDTRNSSYGSSITYHNGSTASCKSEIIAKNVYCAGTQAGFRFGYHGISAAVTKCYVSNCSMTVAPVVMNETGSDPTVNMELIEWNNEIRTP